MDWLNKYITRATLLFFIGISISIGCIIGVTASSIMIPVSFLFVSLFIFYFNKHSAIQTISFFLMWILLGWLFSSTRINEIHSKSNLINSIQSESVKTQSIILSSDTTEYGWRAQCQILTMNESTIPGDFRLTIYGKINMPNEGDTLESIGIIKPLSLKRNPGEFDFKSFYERKNIFGKKFIDKKSSPIIKPNNSTPSKVSIKSIQTYIRSTIQQSTDPKTSGLLLALILGDKSTIDENLKNDFAETGVIHVLAVSGLHVGYILIILTIITSIMGIPWGWDKLLIVLGLIFFCFLTGLKPSVIRASMMASLYVIAPLINRPVSVWNIIGFVGSFLLFIDPLYIVDLGFVLSFSAVISIIYFYKLFESILPPKINPRFIENKGAKFILGLFFVSLSAQIGTLPITVYYFYKIPLISLIANVIIVPLIGIIVVFGFIILGLSFSPMLSSIAGESAWLFQKLISTLAFYFSSFNYSSIPIHQIENIHILLYGILVAGIFLLFQKNYRGKGIIFCFLFLNLFVYSSIRSPKTDIIFMDVGQGDATLIRFSNNKTMLIDAGNKNRQKDWGNQVVIPVLNHFGIKKLDWVMMSHPHADHIGGLVSVVESFPADTLLDSHAGYGSWTYNHLLERYQELGTVIKYPIPGEIIKITPMESMLFFAPDSQFSTSQHNVNNASIVFKLISGNNSILFTGDLEHEGDEIVLPFSNYLKSDVLKVGHHGSITSTTEPFLSVVEPKMAVVSVGENNKFSHPSKIIMDRLKTYNVKIHRTDISGALWISSNGYSFQEVLWK